MKFLLHPEARAEWFDAAKYYESRRPGLGAEFVEDLQRTLQNICEHPLRWAEIEPGIRRLRLDTFPYSLIYRVVGGIPLIIAVPHAHREPHYWSRRL